MLRCRSEEKRSVNLKKATLAAAVCATLAFVYPNLALCLIYIAVMAAGGRDAVHSSIPTTAMWLWLPSLGLAVFLIVFFREQCGRARSTTRRKVARIGAALMGMQAAWLAFSVVQTALRAASSTVSHASPWALVRMTLSGLASSVLWTALLSRFASEEDPLQDVSTKLLALILAADLAVAGLWRWYSFAPTLRAQWRWGYSSFWVVLLLTAYESVVWISAFVFLLSVWRYRAGAAEAGAAAPQDVP
jgi:hypothetical protein